MPKPETLATLRAETPLIAGAVTTLLFFTIGRDWVTHFERPVVIAVLFIWLFTVMIWCAFGVVRHAEALAHYLGEPFGTLILTVSVIAIEITMMATIMLGGGPNPTLPRDTVYAGLMIVLNGMIGASIVVGAWRHREQQYSLQGAVAFLAVISCLAVVSLIVPTFTLSTRDESLTVLQSAAFLALTLALYGGFLGIQTMRHRAFFMDAGEAAAQKRAANRNAKRSARAKRAAPTSVPATVPNHSPPKVLEASYTPPVHAGLLIATLLPIMMLSHPLARVIDFALEDLEAPAALGGILIAILVLSPEGMSSLQAARHNQLQRSVNLSLGSALSTIGLTIPVMLLISLLTGARLELGLEGAETVLLVLTLFISQMTFSGAPTNILLGGVHLVLFFAFVVLIFNP